METQKDAAVDWFLRRSAAPLTADEVDAFNEWLGRAAENREAYATVEKVWVAAGAVADEPQLQARRRAIAKRARGVHLSRRAMAAGLAASVVGLTGAGLYNVSQPKPLVDQSFRTAVGQQATVTLPDGSTITLNTDTAVRTRADKGRRLVYLDRGQAYFRVARDRRRPFVVAAAGRTVTALGTAFDVRVDRGALKVVLVEGKVRVESVARPAAPQAGQPNGGVRSAMLQATEMTAGSQLVAPDDADWRLTRINVTRETSWLKGQIVFDDESLGDIVAELNRYSTRKIVIADPALADERLSGIYTPGDLHGFARALRSYGLAEVKEESEGEVRVVALR